MIHDDDGDDVVAIHRCVSVDGFDSPLCCCRFFIQGLWGFLCFFGCCLLAYLWTVFGGLSGFILFHRFCGGVWCFGTRFEAGFCFVLPKAMVVGDKGTPGAFSNQSGGTCLLLHKTCLLPRFLHYLLVGGFGILYFIFHFSSLGQVEISVRLGKEEQCHLVPQHQSNIPKTLRNTTRKRHNCVLFKDNPPNIARRNYICPTKRTLVLGVHGLYIEPLSFCQGKNNTFGVEPRWLWNGACWSGASLLRLSPGAHTIPKYLDIFTWQFF